jgi:hypothetical protein
MGMKALLQTVLAAGLTSLVMSADAQAAGAAAAVDVQRNINQQARIAQGARSGALTHREVGQLDRGQAHVAAREVRAVANGRVGVVEQAGIQRSENRQSRRVFRKKHNPIVAS